MKKKQQKNDFILKKDDGFFLQKINKQNLHMTQSIITLISDINNEIDETFFTKQKIDCILN